MIKTFLTISMFCVALALIASCSSSSGVRSSSPQKPHHTKDGFKNLYVQDSEKNFFDFLKVRFFGETEWADHRLYADDVPFQKVELSKLKMPARDGQVTWLGHSSFLIQMAGLNILTDPIFSERASPIPFAGPKRYKAHAMDYAELPHIDIVLISHNHYDHLDSPSLQMLAQRATQTSSKSNIPTQFYVPLGLKTFLEDLDIPGKQISEMDWWNVLKGPKASEAYQVIALPSQHWSARGTNDRRETLWASYAVKAAGKTIYFAGDTGYNDVQFKQIGQYLQSVDLALIPIGGYLPRDFMRLYHVNPEEALRIHQDIGSKFSIGMHWGTFPMTAEAPMEPPLKLNEQRRSLDISENAFITIAIGETYLLN
uniref:MBL fold metallo-hydrolase n=1 Tax=Ningiella ruwaisensis TaxID=2364274 RepID=UPI00109FA9FD|nr:MBL fold metallo-hydrolase [Ningiella ruwaisensis]